MMLDHAHCSTCFQMTCVVTVVDNLFCPLIYCNSGCGFRFHTCKANDHKLVCRKEKVPCINQSFGCPLELTRDKMSTHLVVCPASVILCSREWNRWPMHSQDKGWKAPMPLRNAHVRCGQLDVAFAMRDQKILMASKTPCKTRRILCKSLTPATPMQPSYSNALGSLASETLHLSDDELGTPWDLSQSPPGLKKTISNQLSCNDNLYAASRRTAARLVKALDRVTSEQGLQRLAEIAKETKADELQEGEGIDNKSTGPESCDITDSDSNQNVEIDEDELSIYYEKKKLYEVLGVDLTMHFISSYQPKHEKMFTFHCECEFRRDEYPWHVKNFHSDIQCNLNNWFEQRCPLAYLGCTFSFQRFRPKLPPCALVHSPILMSVGVSDEEEFQYDTRHVNFKLPDDENVCTVNERRRLREATPEIYTSYKCESSVHIIPRYKSVSREVSPNGYCINKSDHSYLLTDLPFELLQKIVRNLDSFTIQLISMTCRMLQSVCCSLLNERGMISLVWEKQIAQGPEKGPIWKIGYKRWHFSTGFTPIKEWDFIRSGSPVHEHLKICSFNRRVDKNIKTEVFQMIFDPPDDPLSSHEPKIVQK